MNLSLTEFKRQITEKLLALIWRQWTALGVAGHAEGVQERIIDPEALLLATCHFGRLEPRLFDEMLDWLQKNGWSINTQRLATLLRHFHGDGARVLAAVAGHLDHGVTSPKWTRLARKLPRNPQTEPLFFLLDGRPLPLVGEPDPHFASFGFARGPLRLRGYSQDFRPFDRANLVLQLRALVGVNVRAEIIAYLLTHESGHPSEIARETFYHKRSIQQALGEMQSSGTVELQTSGREKRCWLHAAAWESLLNRRGALPTWMCWPPWFSAMEMIVTRLQDERLLAASPLIQSSELRQLMLQVRPMMERAGFAQAWSDDRQYLGDTYLPVFMENVANLLG
jgi:hypothetical protein